MLSLYLLKCLVMEIKFLGHKPLEGKHKPYPKKKKGRTLPGCHNLPSRMFLRPSQKLPSQLRALSNSGSPDSKLLSIGGSFVLIDLSVPHLRKRAIQKP